MLFRVKVYESLLCKDGFDSSRSFLLVAILVIGMFRASGALEIVNYNGFF